ncbi:PH domain-containing protein [Acaricomes phytoseiuli]|uniref:PH domain-containing protein n=1 Tax=Acaricomes phytoseiuli TaxID=291968 RepID=UPI00036EA69D|nr:PH domain-containing protein [Acaricomes phytoseiuli]MCW1249235.1 PH domain-containing protein [Acaricomes phytoseiuli]
MSLPPSNQPAGAELNRAPGVPGGEVPTVPVLPADPVEQWHRVHPASPAIRGWLALVAIVVIFSRNFIERFFSDGAVGSGGSRGSGGWPTWLAVVLILVLIAAIGIGFMLSWYFTRFQVTRDHVRVNTGVIFRQQRQARIDRVQAIDIIQPLLARILGLAELKFDVADAGKSTMRLAFLKHDEAQQLRASILARAAGLQMPEGSSYTPGAASQVPEAPEREVLRLSPGRIIASVVVSWVTLVFLVLAGVLIWLASLQLWGALIGLIPLAFGLVGSFWQRFAKEFNFRIAVSAAGVRLHYGLVETRSQTIPPGRVQAVGIDQDPLWRLFGWYRVRVNVAGYGAEQTEERSTVLPVGTRQEVFAVLSLVFPDPGTENPERVFTAGLDGSGSAEGFRHSPAAARWIDPLSWRRNAYRATETALLCRHGVLFRQLQVVPHARTQSLQLNQGPLQRLLGLVSIVLHSTPGPVRPRVKHLAVQAGRQLFAEQAERAAKARRLSAPGRQSAEQLDPDRSAHEPGR